MHATWPSAAGPSIAKRQITTTPTTNTTLPSDDTPTPPRDPTPPHGLEPPYPESPTSTTTTDLMPSFNPRGGRRRTKDKGGKGKEPATD
jgi:hypothetical protein